MARMIRTSPRLLVAALAAVLVASCGSSQDSPHSPNNTSVATLDDLQGEIQKAQDVPTFSVNSDPIDVSSLRGKKVFVVPLATTPENEAIGAAMEEAGERVGVDVTSCENKGESAQLSQCLDQALSTKQDVVVLQPDPAALGPQLAALKNAGIPVLSLHYFDEGTEPTDDSCKGCTAGVTAIQPAPLSTPATLMVYSVIAQGGSKANVLIPLIRGLAPTVVMEKVIEEEFAKHCPTCTFKILPISIADVTGSGYQTSVSSALNANPKVDFIIAQTDFLLPATVAALKTTGRDKIKIVSRNGTSDALKMIAANGPLTMVVGESAPWIGYAAMDNAFRLILGQPTNTAVTPVRAWTADNIADAGNPPTGIDGYGDAYKDSYLKLWGLS